jgi:hypothetical protein
MRNHNGWSDDIRQTGFLHFFGGPFHGLEKGLRTAQAISDAVAERREALMAGVVVQRGFDNAIRGGAVIG